MKGIRLEGLLCNACMSNSFIANNVGHKNKVEKSVATKIMDSVSGSCFGTVVIGY